MGSFVPLVGTFAEQKQSLQPRNITKEVTAFDIHLMGSDSIFMELTSFSEFFIITVRKWLNFSAGSRGEGEAASKKIVSRPFQPQFGLKIRGRPRLLPWVRH